MKKIISLVCVIAMLFAFAVTANAADNEVNLVVKEQTAETTVLALNMKSATTIASYSFYIDVAEAVSAGATVTAAITNGTKAQYNSTQKMVVVSYSPTDGSMLDAGEMEICTITISAVDAAYNVARKAESSRTKTVINYKESAEATAVTVTDDFVFATDLTVEPYEEEVVFTPETVKGEVVEGDDANIVLEKDPATAYKNEYTNVAKFEATLGAAVNYSEAGFIWVKDDKESANKFTVDASVIAGGGTFEYAVAMYAIPAGVDIDAIPYYITAE